MQQHQKGWRRHEHGHRDLRFTKSTVPARMPLGAINQPTRLAQRKGQTFGNAYAARYSLFR